MNTVETNSSGGYRHRENRLSREDGPSREDDVTYELLTQTQSRIVRELIIINFFAIIFLLIYASYLLPNLKFQPTHNAKWFIWSTYWVSALGMILVPGLLIIYRGCFVGQDQDGNMRVALFVKYRIPRVVILVDGTFMMVSLYMVLSQKQKQGGV
ncbi:hypothetical protein VNI00_014675 [Paramarasmius palmivorus]|uniref:Transmembrane protein n=1 Tax=Paramarasmius palmivorus TaxID=297713 RepID=A0AAW0BTF5_9AGAR